MKIIGKSSVYFEKYKPSCIQDLILPEAMKKKLQEYIETGSLPNLGLFSSIPGTGKSSCAHAIIKELDGEALWINASLDSGIDVLRGKIQRFAAANSFDAKIKIVVMDEFDHFGDKGQAAFRGFIDEFSQNCRFIFTGNYKDKIIEPLLNRLEVYDFNSFDKTEMIRQIYSHLNFVLDNEKIQHDKDGVIAVIKNNYPSIRGMLSDILKFTVTEEDSTRVLVPQDTVDVSQFANILEAKSVPDITKAVCALPSTDGIYNWLFHNCIPTFSTGAQHPAIICVAKYQAMDSQVRDKQLNLAGCMCELYMIRNSK